MIQPLARLPLARQKHFWTGLAKVTQAVNRDILKERTMHQQSPDQWALLFRKMQAKMLVKAAEKTFRHRLLRQVEKARVENTVFIESSGSDSDVLVVSHSAPNR